MYQNLNDYELIYMIRENNIQSDILYNKYSPIVTKIANFYMQNALSVGLEFQDLYQEGMLGLDWAIRKYYDNNNSLFFTYATICIKSKILNLLKLANGIKKQPLNNSYSYDDISIDNKLYYNKNAEEAIEKINYDELNNKLIFLKNELSTKEAQVMELKINGFNAIEISSLICLSPKTINNYWYKIKQLIKNVIL